PTALPLVLGTCLGANETNVTGKPSNSPSNDGIYRFAIRRYPGQKKGFSRRSVPERALHLRPDSRFTGPTRIRSLRSRSPITRDNIQLSEPKIHSTIRPARWHQAA